MGILFFCDRCSKEMEAKSHRAALLMADEHLLDLCPTCAYTVTTDVKEYNKPKVGAKK